MPELPAMENFRLSIEKEALNKKVKSLKTKKDRVVRIAEASLADSLLNQSLREARRYGKYIFIRFGSGAKAVWLAFHCGMTGFFTFPQEDENEKTLVKAKLLLNFTDKTYLAFFDPRMFGHVEVIKTPEDFIAEHSLGPDALDVTATDLAAMLQDSRKPLKTFFLDQSIIAGIGNVYGDEIPFQAKLSPKRLANSLNKKEATRLHGIIHKVFKTAIAKKAYLDHWDMLPRSWFVHYRQEGTPCPRCYHSIEAYKAGGRDGFWCPGCQK